MSFHDRLCVSKIVFFEVIPNQHIIRVITAVITNNTGSTGSRSIKRRNRYGVIPITATNTTEWPGLDSVKPCWSSPATIPLVTRENMYLSRFLFIFWRILFSHYWQWLKVPDSLLICLCRRDHQQWKDLHAKKENVFQNAGISLNLERECWRLSAYIHLFGFLSTIWMDEVWSNDKCKGGLKAYPTMIATTTWESFFFTFSQY